MTVHPYTGERMRRNVHGEPYELVLQPSSVYTFRDVDGRPLYVGCTGQGYVRFGGHQKKDWWTEVASIEVEHFEDKSDALVFERDLIHQLLPAYNIAGIPASVLEVRRNGTEIWPVEETVA